MFSGINIEEQETCAYDSLNVKDAVPAYDVICGVKDELVLVTLSNDTQVRLIIIVKLGDYGTH